MIRSQEKTSNNYGKVCLYRKKLRYNNGIGESVEAFSTAKKWIILD